jgi:hypothetical protein
LVWIASVCYFAFGIFSKPYPFAKAYQNQVQTKDMPWDIVFKKPLYEIINAPGKGKFPDAFSVIDPQYMDEFSKRLKDGSEIQINFPDLSHLMLSSEFTTSDREYLSRIFWQQRWWRYCAKLAPWLGWGLGPPVCLLLFAFAALWVRRGFVRQSAT